MALERLTIESDDLKGEKKFNVLYNPERYTLNKGVQIAEIAIPGLDSPVLQFVRGQNEKITMELFFDTTDSGMIGDVKDVRTETGKIYQLVKIQPETHAPPRCKLTWGGQLFSFGGPISRCVVESIAEEFTLFSPSGIPLRAKLNVTFREYKTVEDSLKNGPKHSADRTKMRDVKRGQTLSHIAWLEYDDPDEWRRIAEANAIDNPRQLTPGRRLLIPRIDPKLT
jgi:hypothetical protein